jgi:hypothetical protein
MHTTHRKFVVVLERAASSSWYGEDRDSCCIGLNEERYGLYWAAIGPVCLGGLDVM